LTLASQIFRLADTVSHAGRALYNEWKSRPPRQRALAATGLALAAASLILLINSDPACTNRADAEQRLAELMQDLQQQTSDSRLTLEALANRVTDINAAATEFERTSDAHAYCEALDSIR
jgi:type II secretory pathway component PulM